MKTVHSNAETTLCLLLSRSLACWDCAPLLVLDLSQLCFHPWPVGRGGTAASIWVGCLAEMWRAYGSFIRTHQESILEGMRKLNALPALCWALVLWSPNFSQTVKSEDLELKQGKTQIQNMVSTLSSHFTIVFRGHVDTRQAIARFIILTQHAFISIFFEWKSSILLW